MNPQSIQLLTQGLGLMGIGMGFVFSFLIIMIFAPLLASVP